MFHLLPYGNPFRNDCPALRCSQRLVCLSQPESILDWFLGQLTETSPELARISLNSPEEEELIFLCWVGDSPQTVKGGLAMRRPAQSPKKCLSLHEELACCAPLREGRAAGRKMGETSLLHRQTSLASRKMKVLVCRMIFLCHTRPHPPPS